MEFIGLEPILPDTDLLTTMVINKFNSRSPWDFQAIVAERTSLYTKFLI